MALNVKISPVGIDKEIQELQEHIYDTLGWTNYESYGRAYLNESELGIIPEVYTSSGEYKDVKFDDNLNATSFFVISDNRNVEDLPNVNCSLIFQCDLSALYPTTLHRADEEMHRDIIVAFQDYYKQNAQVTSIVTGIDNVYSGMYNGDVKYTDIGERHVVKFEFSLRFTYNCEN